MMTEERQLTDEDIVIALKKQPKYDTVLYLEKGINAGDILYLIQRLQAVAKEYDAEIQSLSYENEKLHTLTDLQEANVNMMHEKTMGLHKEIERLTEERDVFIRLFESVNTSNFSTKSILETLNSFYREQAEHLAGLKIEQAVKDKAKEILVAVQKEITHLRANGHLGREQDIRLSKFLVGKAQDYGVEVE